MSLVLVIGIVVLPILMTYGSHQWNRISGVLDVVAFVALVVLFSDFSITWWHVLRSKQIFMTTIHHILVDPFAIMTAAYIGLYVIYLVVKRIFYRS